MKKLLTLTLALITSSVLLAQSWNDLMKEEKLLANYKFNYKNLAYLADDMRLNGGQIAEIDEINKIYREQVKQLQRSYFDNEEKVRRLMELREKRKETLTKMMGSEDFEKYDAYVNKRLSEALSAQATKEKEAAAAAAAKTNG